MFLPPALPIAARTIRRVTAWVAAGLAPLVAGPSADRASSDQFRAVLDEMAEAVLIYDESGIRYVNPAGASLHGVAPDVLMARRRAQDFVEYLDGNGDRAIYRELPTLKTFITGKAHANEVIGLRRLSDAEVFSVIASAAPLTADFIPNPVGQQVIVTYTDITERRRLEAELAAARHSAEQLAKFDGLTGLPNRNHTVDFLIEAFERSHDEDDVGVVLFFVDLDHFKDVNDSGGHLAGDALLRQVSSRFKAILGDRDLVGRFGGDEFAFVLPALQSPEAAAEIAEQVLDAMREPFEIEGRRVHISASVGIAIARPTGSSVFELLREADAAMYLAKETGRDRYQFFTPALNASTRRRVALLHRVHEALRTGGFELHYQPIVNAAGEPISVEALLRCRDEALGEVRAPELIAIARSAGLMRELGWWVLETATAQLAEWRADGHDISIAVNVDPEQLQEELLVSRVDELLERRGLPPSALEIEVTEEGLVDDDIGAETLRGLRELGVRVAIDDFGTGYSALTYLMTLAISTVKLDRDFIRQIDGSAAHAAVIGHLVELAHALDLTVVAEGVELETTFGFLHKAGCDAFQGYLFSRPVPASQVPALLGNPRLRKRAA